MITFAKAKSSHYFYIALLLLVAILGYWQIAFLKYSVTHDMINCWIPWRYHISQCIQNHIFPFWNPYQQLGYPISADLQGPSWYLESLLLSMTTGQTNYTVHFLFIFYVFMAGMGMYFLSLCFQARKDVAFLTGVCYMLGGFFVAHVQHFYAIIGAAWLPFIILNYYKMHEEKSYLRTIYLSIFMFFNLTGGNHTFSILLVYLFPVLFGYFIYTAVKEKRGKDIFTFISLNIVFVVLSALMATVVFIAFYQTAPYIGRLSGLTYHSANVCPFSPQSLLSWLLPFSTVNSSAFFLSDPSMCNMYFGIIMLLFVMLAFISKKTAIEKVLFVFAIICLFASFGDYTPVHKLLFNYAPLINRFRFPSYFSLFSLILFLLLGAKQLSVYFSNKEIDLSKLFKVAAIIGCAVLLLITWAFMSNHNRSLFFIQSYDTIFDFIKRASLYQNILLQGAIQLFFIGLFIFSIKSKFKSFWTKVASVLIVLDMLITVQLNVGYVGMSATDPKELHAYLATLPRNFPIPSMNNIIENKEELGQKHGLFRNTSIFHKRVSSDVFNSYVFQNYSLLIDSFPVLFVAMQKNPLVYFSDNIVASAKAKKLDSTNITNKTIVLQNGDYVSMLHELKKTKDTLITKSIVIAFSPNAITIKASSTKKQLFTFLQSNYTGWNAFVDNKPTPILLSNYLTMSVLFPQGEHEVRFVYSNPLLVKGAMVSYITFFVLLLFLSFVWIIKKKNYIAPAIIWLILIISAVSYFF